METSRDGGVVPRRGWLLAATLVALAVLGGAAAQAQVTQVNAGNWSDPATWSGGVPGPGSDVLIDLNNRPVTLDVSPTVRNLTIGSSGWLSASGTPTLTATGLTTFHGGDLGAMEGGSGTLIAQGGATYDAMGARIADWRLIVPEGATFAHASSWGFSVATGAVLENRGLLDISAGGNIGDLNVVQGYVQNSGTLRVSQNSRGEVWCPIQSSGTIEATGGDLNLSGGTYGGTVRATNAHDVRLSWGGTLDNTTFEVNSAGTVELASAWFTLKGTVSSTGDGTGQVLCHTGSSTGGLLTPAGETVHTNFATGAPLWIEGAVKVDGTMVNDGVLVHESGYFSGSGSVLNKGTIALRESNNGFKDTLTVQNDGIIEMQGGDLSGRPITNNGTIGILSQEWAFGYTSTVSAPVISSASGVIESRCAGKLSLTSLQGSSLAGTLRASEGATLSAGRAALLSPQVEVNTAGTVTLAGTLTGTLTTSGDGTGSVIISGGALSAAAGQTATLNAAAGAPLRLVGGSYIGGNGSLGGTLENTGTLLVEGGASYMPVVNGTLTNRGTMRHVGSGTYGISGTGTIENFGTYEMTNDGTMEGGLFVNRGTFRKTGGSFEGKITTRFENHGTLEIRSGRLNFTRLVQCEGELVISGAGFTGSTADLIGGTISGTGTLGMALNNTGGTVSPGGSAGKLTINYTFTQGPGGRLLMEIGGTGAGQFDVLEVKYETFRMGGTLEVRLLNGFSPALGDSFDLLNYGGRFDQFDALVLPALGPNLAWDTSQLYTTGLISVGVPEPGAALLAAAAAAVLGLRRRR